MTGTGRKAVLLIVIDALPWPLVTESGFLSAIAPIRGPLKTVLGYSGAALPTLFSGKMPYQHGHWTMYYRDASRSPFKVYKPLFALARATRRQGWVRRIMRKTLPTLGSIKGYFDLYDVPLHILSEYCLAERNDIFSPGGLESVPTIFDVLEERRLSYRVWSWRTPEEANVKEMLMALGHRSYNVFFLYTPDLDAEMHAHGVFSAQALAKLSEQEKWIRDAYERARAGYEEASLLVCSDHGMTDALEGHDLVGHINSHLSLGIPDDFLAFYDSTMARFWGRRPGSLDRVREILGSLDYGRVLEPNELEELGLCFADSAYGELIFLLEPGHVILPSFMGRELPKAMHGYHPDDRFSFGMYASDKQLKTEPHHIRDMPALMLAALDEDPGEAAAAARVDPADV